MVEVFSEGFKQTKEQINKSKNSTAEELNYLIDEIPENCALVSITMRIPGEIKNNRYISRTFNVIVDKFMKFYSVVKEVRWDVSTGPEAFLIVEKDPGFLKQETIKYESEEPLGTLVDINVYAVEDNSVSQITRKELGLEPRKCLVCDKHANDCKRDHNHSVEEMRETIAKIINENITF
ncbi:citrate lyase holo-[acyl-carrier protein] synthase [Companilactobacillus ginsenosidimutans]|uniref:citrate lyase holo-[acyl-carrier protein] synthase n=1 Tax=Companilactobacillus ginsenosidimutans TaxID=1007676 RepID=A0A0H4QHJ2_9LACO|nr:citrate lyase holo-[acyl-carrier protein] synthase [Companilactobacillus ginsenosidimutans]AKP66486.1 hypothetical protein ABM34_02230 [Companilactobacillus ginsenosidimutans]